MLLAVINAQSGTETVIASKVVLADSFFMRMKGLLGRKALPEGEAVVIMECNSIHMFFMQFSIDVIFVDREWRVVGLVRYIRPFMLSPVFWKAAMAIEISVGTIDHSDLQLGQKIQLRFERTMLPGMDPAIKRKSMP